MDEPSWLTQRFRELRCLLYHIGYKTKIQGELRAMGRKNVESLRRDLNHMFSVLDKEDRVTDGSTMFIRDYLADFEATIRYV